MSKSALLDKIKNPDVPGLEEEMPEAPPPPIISITPSESVEISSNDLSYIETPGIPYFNPQPMETSIPANQPWWIPNETDSELYSQWYESAYKAALRAAQEKDSTGKARVKYFNRKTEVIDPKTDAERVANAQKELSELMKPLQCDLCNAVMNSTLQARLHYQGKPHQKKVSMYLNQSAKKLKTEDQVSSTTATPGNDWNTYCEICKIWFTSQIDANQHYAGKKHLRAAFGTPKTKSSKKNQAQSKIPIDPTGRFGIGMGFHPEAHMVATPLQQLPPPPPPPPENPPIIVPPVPQYSKPSVPLPTPFRCDLCDITANRQDQLDTHKRGTRHLKMLKLHGLPIEPAETTSTPGTIDYSIYRTPSGQYYCAPCNISLNSEVSFGQHVESKKHKNQLNPKPQPTQAPPTKKSKKM